jgi:hypothetical protein
MRFFIVIPLMESIASWDESRTLKLPSLDLICRIEATSYVREGMVAADGPSGMQGSVEAVWAQAMGVARAMSTAMRRQSLVPQNGWRA